MEKDYTIRVLSRALAIMECFDNNDSKELTLKDIISETGLSKSTAFRLLLNLRDHDFLSMTVDGKFTIGNEIIRLASIAEKNDILKNEAFEILRRFSELSDETVILAKYDNYRAICVDKVESQKVLKIASQIGKTVPLFMGATGKIISAYLSKSELKKCLPVQQKLFQQSYEEDALYKALSIIREQGYCTSLGEVDEGVAAISVPVLGSKGRVLGSISIVGPEMRFNHNKMEELKECLVESSNALSKRMGYVDAN